MHTIKLTRFNEDPIAVVPNKHVWPLRVSAEAEANQTMPSEIFVYHKDASGYAGDKFVSVASVPQLDTLPLTPDGVVASDDGNLLIPFYRVAEMQVNCASLTEREELWDTIYKDVQDLVANYKLAENLVPVEEVLIPDETT